MARAIRFHLDVVCYRLIAAGLRQRGVDVATTAEAGLLGTVKKTAVFLTAPVAQRLAPRNPTSVRCDEFLYCSGKRMGDDHRLYEGFDDVAKPRLAA